MLRALSDSELTALERDFIALAHAHQEPPALGANGKPWTTWLVLAGRGAGKTRLGAEWVRALVKGEGPYADAAHRHIALIGETEHDAREVMIEGPAGILRSPPPGERPLWIPSRRRLEWPNGAVALCFSAEDPEQLRGPQFDAAWCDELAKWHQPLAARRRRRGRGMATTAAARSCGAAAADTVRMRCRRDRDHYGASSPARSCAPAPGRPSASHRSSDRR